MLQQDILRGDKVVSRKTQGTATFDETAWAIWRGMQYGRLPLLFTLHANESLSVIRHALEIETLVLCSPLWSALPIGRSEAAK